MQMVIECQCGWSLQVRGRAGRGDQAARPRGPRHGPYPRAGPRGGQTGHGEIGTRRQEARWRRQTATPSGPAAVRRPDGRERHRCRGRGAGRRLGSTMTSRASAGPARRSWLRWCWPCGPHSRTSPRPSPDPRRRLHPSPQRPVTAPRPPTPVPATHIAFFRLATDCRVGTIAARQQCSCGQPG
jgi:hypothetical protein